MGVSSLTPKPVDCCVWVVVADMIMYCFGFNVAKGIETCVMALWELFVKMEEWI